MLKDKFHGLILIIFILAFSMVAIITGVNVPFAIFFLYAALCYLISFRIKFKRFYILLFLFAFFIRLAYILWVNTPPESDFKLLFDAALDYARGDYSFNETYYFKDWAYQTGFVIYEGTVIKFVGAINAELVLKILNALFSSATCLLVYIILKSFVSESVSRFSALLCVGLLFPLTFVTVLSNQHISTFFLLLGLLLVTDKNLKLHGIIRGLLAGLALALGNIMRPEGIVLIAALLLYFVLSFIKPGEEARRGIVTKALILFIIYFGVNFFASQIIIEKGINPEGLRNNNTLWKFVVGLNFDSKGSYSIKDYNHIYNQNLTVKKRNDLELSIIKERLQMGAKKSLSLFVNKQFMLWGGDPLIWSYRFLENTKPSFKVLAIELPFDKVINLAWGYHNLQIFVILTLSIMGAIFKIKAPMNQQLIIYYLILLASVSVYLFTEVQPRYIYLQEFVLLITAAKGIEVIVDWVSLIPKASKT